MQSPRHGAMAAPGAATRGFALQCLLQLLEHLASDPDTSVALHGNVQALVQCAFSVVEDKVESLKSAALALLARVLAAFSGAPDPETADEGGRLMDVFAAPYVTALKTCLGGGGGGASPIVTQAAMLAADMLTCGMLRDDAHSTEVTPFQLSASVCHALARLLLLICFFRVDAWCTRDACKTNSQTRCRC